MARVEMSDTNLPEVTVDSLIADGVRQAAGWMQTSSRLFHTDRVTVRRWAEIKDAIDQLETKLGHRLVEARAVLGKIGADPWARLLEGQTDP